MALDPIPFEYFKKFQKVSSSKRILFKKIAVIHGKGEFFKIKGSICNVPIEAANYAIFCEGQQFPMDCR